MGRRISLPGVSSAGFMAQEAGDRFVKNDKYGLTRDESGALNLYTMDSAFFFELNKRCRSRNRDAIKVFFPAMKHMLKAATKLPKFVGVGWRGVKGVNLTEHYKKGDIVWWWGWSSVSMNLHTLQQPSFMGQTGVRTQIMIEFENAVDVTEYSVYPGEKEVLLLPGTLLRVIGTAELGNGLFSVHLKEEPPPEPVII